jgi:hypothetical protein
MFAVVTERTKFDGQMEGVIPHLVDDGLSILQYNDDTIPFMEHDIEKVRKLEVNSFSVRAIIGSEDKLP